MNYIEANIAALHVGDSAQNTPPDAVGSATTSTDLNGLVVEFLNQTVNLISAEDRPSSAVGITMRKLFENIRDHCVKMKATEGLLVYAFATYSVFLVWWVNFLKAEEMPQFGRPIRGVGFGAKGFKLNKLVSLIFRLSSFPN